MLKHTPFYTFFTETDVMPFKSMKLVTTKLSIDTVANNSGIKESELIRRHFLCQFSASPSDYHKQLYEPAFLAE